MTINLNPTNWKETCLFIMKNVKSFEEVKRDILTNTCSIHIIRPFPNKFDLNSVVINYFGDISSVIYEEEGEFFKQGGEFHSKNAIKAFEEYFRN